MGVATHPMRSPSTVPSILPSLLVLLLTLSLSLREREPRVSFGARESRYLHARDQPVNNDQIVVGQPGRQLLVKQAQPRKELADQCTESQYECCH